MSCGGAVGPQWHRPAQTALLAFLGRDLGWLGTDESYCYARGDAGWKTTGVQRYSYVHIVGPGAELRHALGNYWQWGQ